MSQTDNIYNLIVGTYNEASSLMYQDYDDGIKYPAEYGVKSFKTLRIKLPRRLGISTACYRVLNEIPDSVLIVPDHTIEKYTKQHQVEQLDFKPNTWDRVLNFERIKDRNIQEFGINRISIMMFDPISKFNQHGSKLIEFIMKTNHNTKLFVHCG